MFDFDFAYSGIMQAILIFVSFITTIIFYTLTTNIILLIYGENVSFKRKALFIFLTGTVMNNIWTYAIYFFGGKLDFTPLIYNLVTIPNPIFAILFFILGVKILTLSPYRSITLISNAYVFIMVIKIFQRIIGFIFLPQSGEHWNYLLDTISQIITPIAYVIIYILLKRYLIKSNFTIRLTDNIQYPSFKKEILFFFIKTSSVYAFSILYPIYANNNKNLYIFIMLIILVLALIIGLLMDYIRSLKIETMNKAMHIKNQNITIDGFNKLRHELNNMLQSYGGYITIGDMEKLMQYHKSLLTTTVWLNDSATLNKKLEENAALISLLLDKHKLAEKEHVSFRININCDIKDLYIDASDLCSAIENLLDTAVETAKESPKKQIEFSIEERLDANKLIVISFSTKEDVSISSTASAHITPRSSIGLHHTRQFLSKYQNCVAQLVYYDFELTAYISISKIKLKPKFGGGVIAT